MSQKTATFVRFVEGWRGIAELYKLDPPMEWEDWGEEGKTQTREAPYVIVSAVFAYSGPETYIFPANSKGEVVSWGELEGSFRGELDIKQALLNAGYKVVKEGQTIYKREG